MRKLLSLATALLSGSLLLAQAQPEYAKDTGFMHHPDWTYVNRYINSQSHFPPARLGKLEQSLKTAVETVLQAPLFHPPKGFQLVTMFEPLTSQLTGLPELPAVAFHFNLHYLTRDPKSGNVKKSQDFVTLNLEVNRVDHLFEEQGSFAEDCRRLHLPLFFEQPPVTDSTADYMELNFKNYGAAHAIPAMPIRILTKDRQPLWIPFSRKEYFQYLLVKKQAEIDEAGKNMQLYENEISRLQKEEITATDSSMKKAMQISITGLQKQMPVSRENLRQLTAQKQHYAELMKAMSPQEAGAPAWVNFNHLGPQMDYLDVLLPYGQKNGTALFKINPQYFNSSGIELITVYAPDATSPDADYLEKEVGQLFYELDYHKLKKCME